jgi:parvulin-like peptidyl-prolyl isomerase
MLRSLILSAAALTLASQAPAPEASKAPKAPKAAVASAKKPAADKAAAQPKEDKILATIGKEVVRESDFDLFLSISLNDQQRMQLQFMPGGKDQYLTRFLEFKVLAAKARKDGFQNHADYKKKLAMMDMQLLITALMERDGPPLQAKLALKDEEIKAYFDKHPDQFKAPETFNARHILVAVAKPKPPADPKDAAKPAEPEQGLSDEAAKAKVAKIQAELAAGKTFDAAAKEYSEDPGSKDKGGLYESVPFGSFVPEFEAAVRTQPLGKVGAPVKTNFGYHLIQVEKVNPASTLTFEAAKESARKLATDERQKTHPEIQEKVMQDYMNTLKAELKFVPAAAPAKAAPKAETKDEKVAK